tara:strand:+ start:696 stop:1406 length:711 start_codon:yes stop_codon:yes gene_type:complete
MSRLRRRAAEGGARYARLAPGSVIVEIVKAENFAPTREADIRKGKHNYAIDMTIRVIESDAQVDDVTYKKIFTGQYKADPNNLGGMRGWLVVTDPTNTDGYDKQCGNVSNFQDAAVQCLDIQGALSAAQEQDAAGNMGKALDDQSFAKEDAFWEENPVFADRGSDKPSAMKGRLVRAVTHWQTIRRGEGGMCITRFQALSADEEAQIREVWLSNDREAIQMLDFTGGNSPTPVAEA